MKNITYELREGFLVAKPVDYEPVPIFCPVCETIMRTSDDVYCFKQNKCCFACESHFIKPEIKVDKSSEYFKKYIDYRKKQFTITLDFE
jgi:hypothetical protein